SGQLSGTLTVTFTFDPLFTFVSAWPAPDDVSGNTVTWTLPPMQSFQIRGTSVVLSLPPDPGLIGMTIASTFDVSDPVTETSTANNTYTTGGVITSSLDPNDKTVCTSTRESDTQ